MTHKSHYPGCQTEMIQEIAEDFRDHPVVTVIPFCEPMIMQGDHAGISETSFMLYLERDLVDMTRMGEANYQDHGWTDTNSPEKATCAKGEDDVNQVITYLKNEIKKSFNKL